MYIYIYVYIYIQYTNTWWQALLDIVCAQEGFMHLDTAHALVQIRNVYTHKYIYIYIYIYLCM